MTGAAARVQRTYLTLTLLVTLSASLIWGVNTLFLLDAGLSNTEAFLANAAYSLGMVLFEIPTGVVADTRGRRFSFLLGAASLLIFTLGYFALWYYRAPLAAWLVVSMLLGLGFTFLSGATEAWLVDALSDAGVTTGLEAVFGRAQAVAGVAMLAGSVLGGIVAQASTLGVPYLVRAGLLVLTLAVAWVAMHDLGFIPDRQTRPLAAVRRVLAGSVDAGLRNRPMRWLMLAATFSSGTGIYVFYALQPYLLGLYGDPGAYSIAGLAAALVAGAQWVGGLLAARVARLFRRRTDAMILGAIAGVALLLGLGLARSFTMAVVMISAWALVGALTSPIRQALVDGVGPSAQRATVLSFDSLMGSAGGVVTQPALGGIADVLGYPASYLTSAVVSAVAIPFTFLARREQAPADQRVDPGTRGG